MKIETLYNNAHPPLRGGIPVWAVGWVDVGIDPYGVKIETRCDSSWPVVGAVVRPYGVKNETQCNNALPPLRGCFRFGGWVDVGIDPYGAK